MNATRLRAAVLLAILIIPAIRAFGGQSYYEYKFVFQGTAYQTNGSGNIVATPITDQTLLADRAAQGGITNLSTVAIVYHINGDPKGDTVEMISTNGTTLALEFGFWYGDYSDPGDPLGRTALTNSTLTEVKRVDYIYTLDDSTYTYPNSHSMGAAFTSKRFLTDTNNNTNASIEGNMSWIVNPQDGRSTIVCTGNFTLGTPMF